MTFSKVLMKMETLSEGKASYEVGKHLELFYSIFLETLQECSHGIFLQLRRLEHFPVPTFSLEQGVNYVQHAVNSFDIM